MSNVTEKKHQIHWHFFNIEIGAKRMSACILLTAVILSVIVAVASTSQALIAGVLLSGFLVSEYIFTHFYRQKT